MKQKTITTKKPFNLFNKQQFGEYIRGLAWSPDGNVLGVISAGGELALWQEGKIDFLQPQSNYSLDCIGFSADGKWLATGGQASQIQIYQLTAISQTFELITTLDCGTAWIDSLVWHPQENLLAFAINRQVKIWDGKTQKIIATLDFSASSVFSLAWNRQGNRLAASGHGAVKVWNSRDWKQTPTQLEVPGASLDCAWSFDGQYLASGNLDRTISLLHWDHPPPWLMQGFPAKVSQVVWSNHQNQPLLAASCQEGIIIWHFDPQSQNWQSHVLQHQKIVQAIAFAPNSSLLASAGQDGCIQIWQQGKKRIQTLKGVAGFSSLAWHPAGKYLAAGGQEGELTIWQSSFLSKGFGNH